MKKLIAAVLAVVMLAGCTGSFALTRKVYSFHRNMEGKWMDELVFLGCVILPVYSLATLGDGIIFNSIEFWTGDNPIKEAKGKTLTNGDLQVMLSYSEQDDSVRVVSLKSLKPNADFRLTRNENGVVAQDKTGKTLFTSVTEADGGITVYDGNKMIVRHFSPAEIREVSRKFKAS